MASSKVVFFFSLVTFVISHLHSADADSNVTSNKSVNLTICERRQNEISEKSPHTGYLAAFIAIIMFGSNFVPVKKIRTGDGMFFQWIFCLGIWFMGIIIHLCNGEERQFFPLAMIGGALWCTGNIFVVAIIKTIGLALGLLIWGLLNLLTGWATARSGTFGLICKQPVSKSELNYVGVALAVISLGIFLFVKNEPLEEATNENTAMDIRQNITGGNDEERNRVVDEETHLLRSCNRDRDISWINRLSENQKHFVGIFLSIISGILFGTNFLPVYIIQKNDGHAPVDGLQYVFSQFCGTFLASSIYFLIYCLYKRNKPDVFSTAVAPGFLSGVLWAVGQVMWFVANTNLSESVSFPIITTGPGVIASLWGILIFKEIKGLRNFVILGVAFCFLIGGAIITGCSK